MAFLHYHRLDQFKELLLEPVIDLNRLRKMCFNGKLNHCKL